MCSVCRGLTAIILLMVFLPAGCGGPNKVPLPDLVPVSGKVIYQGNPVVGGDVQFIPLTADLRAGLLASGLTDSAGSFSLSTHPHGDGAKPDAYKVLVRIPIPGSRTLPEKYADAKTTPFQKIEIPASGKKDLVLNLTD